MLAIFIPDISPSLYRLIIDQFLKLTISPLTALGHLTNNSAQTSTLLSRRIICSLLVIFAHAAVVLSSGPELEISWLEGWMS
jgi:hypothetical protein